MSTPDKSSRNDGEVIIVTLILRPNGSHVSPFPKRQFILSYQTPSIRIGRASKATTKGFVASIDNAWFDSPVMSRQHAELVLDCESTPKAVYIQDIGSLHGTFHTPYDGIRKESRLEQRKPVRLSNGDSLRFGTDIFRGSETFPPCFVDFYMIGQEQEPHNQPTPIVHQPANRVFTIPDDDLDDDDEDDSDSDSDSVIETAMPSSRKLDNQSGPSIDLTQDEADEADGHMYPSNPAPHKNVNSDVIDLTSEPGENSDPEPTAIRRRHSADSLSTTVRVLPTFVSAFGAYPSNLPTGTGHSQKPMDFETEPDRSSDHNLHLHRQDEELSSDDLRLTDSDNDSIITRDSFDSTSDSFHAGDDPEEEQREDEEHESSTSGISDYRGRFRIWVDEDESLDDLPYSDDASSSSNEDSLNLLSNSSSPAPESSPYSSPNAPVAKEAISDGASIKALADSSDSKRPFVTPFLFTAAAENDGEVAHPREPSPSDAAMFKSRPMLDRTPSDSRAQALGEKSGKFEFFAARESNRTTFSTRPSPLPSSTIRETPGLNSDQPAAGPEADHHSPPALPVVRVDDSHTKPTEEAVDTVNTVPKVSPPVLVDLPLYAPLPEPSCQTWSVSGEKFINNPRNEDLPYPCLERPPSPELDMTSAYTFQLSKMATESSATQKPRRVGIEDLLTLEPHGIRPGMHDDEHTMMAAPAPIAPLPLASHTSREHVLKRSFEDAFSDSHIELDVRPSSNDTHIHVKETRPESTSHQNQSAAVSEDASSKIPTCKDPLVPLPQDGADVVPSTIRARADNVQPSKRRRFAQAAACVALGGAAAFTFMVSTAPVL
ncbi:hypothetical protein F5Y06DRAFT_101694 [Hypoxylon sp. FL0890]|nr:hypothetical protein F5Y06DRAFT_101694 [Hypoxylon sp. FL0890]